MQCDYRRNLIILFVWLPLLDVQFFFRSIGIFRQCYSDVIQAFERTHRSGAYSNSATVMIDQLFDRSPIDGDILRMHLMSFYLFAFHGLEGSCAYMKCQFFQINAFFLQCFQYTGSEVQSGCRCGYRAFYFGINGLISFFIALFRIPVQIWGNRQFSEHFEDIGKGYFRIVPGEINPVAGAPAFSTGSGQSDRETFYRHLPFQCSVFPFLQVTDHAEPGSVFRLLEVQYIIVGLNRFQTEDLDQRPRFFAEVEACLNHLRVVEYHQASFREIVRQGCEDIFAYFTVAIYQQF